MKVLGELAQDPKFQERALGAVVDRAKNFFKGLSRAERGLDDQVVKIIEDNLEKLPVEKKEELTNFLNNLKQALIKPKEDLADFEEKKSQSDMRRNRYRRREGY